MRVVIFCLICRFLSAYQDEELAQLWISISDMNQPTIEDYQRIETYLNGGERPYLDGLRQRVDQVGANTARRLNNILNFKLLGPNGQGPIFEVHRLNTTEATKNRCILLFGSFNGIYEQKVRRVLEELRVCKYSGDVLVRIGGFPNVQNGGLKICHVPYAFKVAFLQEARARGYEEVLWIDTCMHPLSNLERIFSKIGKRGYFFTYAGTLRENESQNLLEAAEALNIGLEQYDIVNHISSGILGFNMGNAKALQLLDGWFAETKKTYPNITWFPEELSLSVVAWRLGLSADCGLKMIMCGDNELGQSEIPRPTLQFYCEEIR